MSPGCLHGVSYGTAHQTVQREQGPRLNHVNPPNGNEEALGPAWLLGVQREVTEEVVGSLGPGRIWTNVGGTNLIHRLQQNKEKQNLNDSAGD